MRQKLGLGGGFLVWLALLLPVVALGADERVMPADLDVDAFALWEAPIAKKSAGQLLRAEPLDRKHAFYVAMPDFRGTATRVLYATVDGNGDPATSTGVVIVPDGAAPRGGWPVVAWAHGTVGVSDCTAPSRTSGPDVIAGGYARTWAAWFKEGYAVIASDYAGHGTQGETFYADGRSQAYNTADLLRAARQLPRSRKISNRYVVTGHSQGGQTAVFAAAVNAEYAPELRLVGTIALSPAVGWTTGAPRIQDRRPSVVDGSHPLAKLEAELVPRFLDKLLAGLQAIDFTRGAPGRTFEPSEYFTQDVINAAEKVKSSAPCTVSSVPPNVRWALRSEDPNGGLLQDPVESWLPFVARFEPPLDPAAYDVPLHILTGMADPLTSIRSIQPFADVVFAGGRVQGGLRVYGYAEIGPRNWLGDHFGFELEPEPFADSVAIVHRLFHSAQKSPP